MAKSKNKADISSNFENLKAQMLKKKEMAETLVSNNDLDHEESKDIKIENHNIENDIESEHINNDVIEYKFEAENDNKKEKIESDSVTNSRSFLSSKTTEVKDVNVNRIVIKKVEKQETPKRITYYLKPETIKKIDKFSKMAGMGKSEFVQTLLEEVLNNLEIEK
ncbi:hypothetical protein [Clostridium frigidicarnis]|uniref:Ribbon-helix-helix protein, copG family n=1 Tax=Clostridium frigidicarnis TaxID=84698 RepID=A0A1I1B6M9_9CLOT|nr:hypothetical protein [Clostridium frigidicarnis]SFB45999.1 hypothetical protein SAMN04488528_10718 [Clostridium frigidicarnis]